MKSRARVVPTGAKNASFSELVGEASVQRALELFESGKSYKKAAVLLGISKLKAELAWSILQSEREDSFVAEEPDDEEDAASMASLDFAPAVARAIELAKEQRLAAMRYDGNRFTKKKGVSRTFGLNLKNFH